MQTHKKWDQVKKNANPPRHKKENGDGRQLEVRTKSFIRHRIFKEQKKIHNEKDLNISLANAENVGDEKYSVFHGKDNIKWNGAVCIRKENFCEIFLKRTQKNLLYIYAHTSLFPHRISSYNKEK